MYTASSYTHTFCYGDLGQQYRISIDSFDYLNPPPRPFVPAVDKQGGALSSMGLVDLPPELQKRAGLIGYSTQHRNCEWVTVRVSYVCGGGHEILAGAYQVKNLKSHSCKLTPFLYFTSKKHCNSF